MDQTFNVDEPMSQNTEPVSSLDSVRLLRQQYQQQAPAQRALQLFHASAELLLNKNLEMTAEALLKILTGSVGCQHACLLRYHAGRLHCIAGLGHAPPSQLKMPVSGFLNSLLKFPTRDALRVDVTAPWVFMQGQYAFEWFIPMCYASQVTGLLVLAGNPSSVVPNLEIQQSLNSLACFLGGMWHEASSKRKLSESAQHDLKALSPREREIMALLPKGMSNQRIATHLGIATGTVKTHIERILSKLQLEDRAHAAARAVELKLGGTQ